MSTPHEILRSVFGYADFVGPQRAIIETIVSGRDAVVLMPTGGGKSLCYQIPALIRPGTGVVVSPLIALMRDQVQGLTQMGVRAAALNSSLSSEQARTVEGDLVAGRLDLIYVAPERLVLPSFLEQLARIPLALFAIDEAHCVSQWGHDFRPEYTRLAVLAERFPGVPRLALTATADEPTRRDIVHQLGLESARLFASGFDRPNIRYLVAPKDQPERQLLEFLRSRPAGEAGIVYRMSRKKVEATAARLAEQGFVALPYHAGLDPATRAGNQERFMREDGVIMVATVAFGMGVDKPNVRFVAHLDPPSSLEAYHQETGRAGRDGLPAVAWMVYGLADIAMLRRLVAQDDARTQGPAGQGDTESRQRHERLKQHKLTALLGYCETTQCRRQVLLRYFGQELAEPCGNCDTCLEPVETWDGTIAAQKALSNIFRTGARFGAGHLANVLIGKQDAAVARWGHDTVSTFGIGDELSRSEWLGVYRQLAAAGLVDVDLDGFGALTLNARSWDVMKGREAVRLRRDPPPTARIRAPRLAAPTDAALQTPEARTLWDSLRALRLRIAQEQNVPPYAVFADRTLLEMIRFRPQGVAALLGISGVGRTKLRVYGERFVEVLAAHEAEHGRPDGLPPLPAPPPDKMIRADGVSETERASVELLRSSGSVAAVAQARNLKPATVYAHLTKAVARGELSVEQVTGLSAGEIARIGDVVRQLRAQGFATLTAVHEALDGAYGYEILRCVLAGMETP